MYNTKRIMREITIDEATKIPAIRIDVVMDSIPEDKQFEVESALRDFADKAEGVVAVAFEQMTIAKNVYSIKKIMQGVFLNQVTKAPLVRINVVMDSVPDEMQPDVESNLKDFTDKVMGIVLVDTITTPIPKD